MKKYLINLFVFILLVLIAYPVMVYAWVKLIPPRLVKNINYLNPGFGQLDLRLKDANSTDNVDLLILGSSHAYRGYDPRIFEKKTDLKIFNLGSLSQTPVQTELLLNKYIDKLNPKFVIIDIFPVLLGSDGIESSLDLIANNFINEKSIQLFSSHKNIMVLNCMLYRMISSVITPDGEHIRYRKGDQYIKGGYTQSYKRYAPKSEQQPRIEIKVSDAQISALERIIKALKSRNINYVLIQAPVTDKKGNSVVNAKQVDARIDQFGKYYNFNHILKLNNSYFYDDHHLNQYGVEIFNQALIKTINLKHIGDSIKNPRLITQLR